MAEITDVLTKLLERTNEGKVQWKPTSNERTFAAVVGTLSVMILTDQDGLVLSILDKSGREIERLTNYDFRTPTEVENEMIELYKIARHAALNVGSQLDELLKELG
ncbi:MAG: hypothetical protein ACE5Q6_01635 [Dehalococcoidia bacterium]